MVKILWWENYKPEPFSRDINNNYDYLLSQIIFSELQEGLNLVSKQVKHIPLELVMHVFEQILASHGQGLVHLPFDWVLGDTRPVDQGNVAAVDGSLITGLLFLEVATA